MMKEFKLPKLFNWQKASEKIVKTYVAELSQSGTNVPVATVLYNDTDVAFTFQRNSAGFYVMIASENIFTSDKKAQVEFTNDLLTLAPTRFLSQVVPSATQDLVYLFSTQNNNGTDGLLGSPNRPQTTIKVTLYN